MPSQGLRMAVLHHSSCLSRCHSAQVTIELPAPPTLSTRPEFTHDPSPFALRMVCSHGCTAKGGRHTSRGAVQSAIKEGARSRCRVQGVGGWQGGCWVQGGAGAGEEGRSQRWCGARGCVGDAAHGPPRAYTCAPSTNTLQCNRHAHYYKAFSHQV